MTYISEPTDRGIDPEAEYLLGLPLDHYTTDDGDMLAALWAKLNPTD